MSAVPSPRSETRVLVVDDEHLIAEALRRVLRREFEVSVCGTATEARALFEAGERFDVILSDMMMPGFSGMDLFEWLKETAPSQARRLIFTSGGAVTEQAQFYQATMPDRFIHKPFDILSIGKTLGEFLKTLD